MAIDKALRGRNFQREAEDRKAKIDALIDAYELPGVRASAQVIDVDCFPGEIKFAITGPDGRLHYRGRVLRCVKKRTASAERFNAKHQEDLERLIQQQREGRDG